MKKRIFSFVLAVLMIASLLPATALAADIVDSGTCGAKGSNLTWTLDSEGVLTISGSGDMHGYGPSDAPWHGRVKSAVIAEGVTSISWYAFYNCRSLTSVTIPNSVTSIGEYAFYDCTSLTSVTIPDSVTSICEYAFQGCTSLTSVTIPDSVTRIGAWAFESCTSLTSVTIPDSVTRIGSYAFRDCASLTGIWVAEGNSHYSSDVSGVLFNKDKTTLVQCPGAFAAYTIPNSVTIIGDSAFFYCTSLTSVTIPDSVTSIGESSFYKCTSLTSVTIPDSVTSIGAWAFGCCTSLTSVTIPDSVTSIGEWAFYYCTSLTSVTISNSVTIIGDSAFSHCKSLTSVAIPDSVTIIGDSAFFYCTSLTSVTIPDSVTIIEGGAFSDCDNLTDVYYTGTEIAWNKIKISDYNDALKNATIHYFSEWTREKEPTCTEPGSETSVCPEAGCGKTFTREIPALGHSWDEGKVTKPATEAEDGVKTFTCTRCGETKTETIPKLAHEHSYKAVVTAPTCTEKGYTTHTCSCGDSYVDTYTDPLGHDLKDDAAVAATCTTAGTTAGKHCTRCDYKEGMETIAALGHDLKDDAAVAATCTTAGTTAGKHCTRCDYKEGMETIAALGHDLKDDAAVAATCTTAGTTAGKHCTRCDYKEGMETIAALGHAWDEGMVTKEATETTQGSMTYTCTRCQATKRDILPASGLVATAVYNDVKNDTSWFYPGVQYCLSYGLMSGMGNGSFAPGEYTTRAQVAQILYNLHGNPEVSGGTPFTDVPEGAWYQKAVTWAHSVGIVNGVTATTFSPNANITRQDFVLMLMRYLNNVRMVDRTWTPDDLSRFADAGSVGFWALDAMKDAVAINAISGAPVDGRLYIQPARNATRAEAAKILMIFHETMTK